jgi:RNA polymerase-binding transcription factor DksA
MDQATTDSLRRRLDEERVTVSSQLVEMGLDPETGAPNGVEFEQGFADSGQATAEGLVETLHEVDAAIDRIEKGTYGTCESCGAEIPPERLDARPVASLCLDCKQRLG